MTQKIRVAVGEPAAMHSGPWTIWTTGDELYVSQTTAQGLAKLSVHSSGVCRYAWSEGSGIVDTRDRDPRVADRWTIERVGETPWSRCFSLMVPSVYLPDRFSDQVLTPKRRAGLQWIPAAPLMLATWVSLFRAKSADQDISEILTGDYRVLETLSLRSGGLVWVVTHEERLAPKDYAWWQKAVGEFRTTMTGGPRDDDEEMFASIMTPASKSAFPFIREVALGWSNILLGA